MNDTSRKLPVVALRGMTVLPGMLIHFDINREITIAAVENAMLDGQMVFIVMQKDEKVEKPKQEDLYQVGTIAVIKQLVRLPENIVRVMVSGIERASLVQLSVSERMLQGEVSIYKDKSLDNVSDIEKTAMLRNVKELLHIYFAENSKISKTSYKQLIDINNIELLLDQIAINLSLALEDKQMIINELECKSRYEKISVILSEEIEIARIKRKIQEKVKSKVDQNQKEYVLREQLKVIQEELGENNVTGDADTLNELLKKLKAPKEVKEKIRIEIGRFKNASPNSSESSVIRSYIQTLLSLPWNKESKDNNNLKNAADILNRDHYGLVKVKDRILEFLAVRALTKKGESPIICLVGPPGTGKTSIARSVAEALNKKYIRLSLGGVRDEAEIRGHRRTYVGAMPGSIIKGLMNAGVKNPLMLLDEIDKVSSDYKGDTASALLEVLDTEQNHKFLDHYIDLPVDLSDVMFISTANSIQTIPKPLLDRMEVIEVSSYTENEKVHIAEDYLISKQMKKNGLREGSLSISTEAISKIINGHTREAGVRNLERKIGKICRMVAREIVEGSKNEINVTEKNIGDYLGKERFTFDSANEKDEIGIVRGLAWTSVGGDTLQIEVNVIPGKGKFELTGQLGDVMKESAKTGISYIRSISEQYQMEKDFFEKNDIHIHIPEGAVPKDGPSAGITMATAMISAITKRKVKANLAMTGEITLRGRVLPVGGLKEKILAAKIAKIRTVLVPKKNEKDILEIEQEILNELTIQYVDNMEEVLFYALV